MSLSRNDELTPEEISELLDYHWSTGQLRGLLYDHQWPMYDLFHSHEQMSTVFHCARRIGKSAVDMLILLEICLQKDGRICRFAAATQDSVREILLPMLHALCETAPAHLKPYFHSSGRFLFPHRPNSQLVIAGLDLHPDRLRGPACHGFVIDEAGFTRDLEYAIKDIVMPQFLTTDGRLILSSTSPKTPAHPFVQRIEKAKLDNTYIQLTIYDDSREAVRRKIPLFMAEAGGEDSTTWKREYLCQIIVDEESALVPEFSRPEVRAKAGEILEMPPHLIATTAIDLGYIDNAAAVFGYVDFQRGRRVILDELLLNRKNSEEIAQAVLAKENELWGPVEGRKHKLRRYADGQPLTIADFNDLHRCAVTKVSEDTPEAKVNQVRLDLKAGILKIHPRCRYLWNELQYGIWNDAHTKFARVEGTFGHFDLLSSLTYFVRHTSLREDPFPTDWNYDPHEMQRSQNKPISMIPDIAKDLKTMFKL